MLTIKGKNIRYKEDTPVIFENLNLSFCDHGIYGFLGESGVGKTSFFKSLMLQLMNAEITYDNKVISDDLAFDFIRNNIFFVDQFGTFFENMTIKQHFEFYGEMTDQIVNKDIIHKWLAKVNISEVNINKSPSQLSIGERKRFLISLALFSQKPIIILDEVTASLDDYNIKSIKQLLLETNQLILVSSHNHDFFDICDVIYKIEDKQVIEIKKKNLVDNRDKEEKCYCFNPFHYLKYKTFFQWFKQLFIVLFGLFICFQISSGLNDIVNSNKQFLKNDYILKDNIIYFRNRFGNQDYKYIGKNFEKSKPLTQDQINIIKSIDGVEDVIPFFTIFNDDFTGLNRTFSVKHQNQKAITYSGSSDGRSIALMPHLKNNNKIYISSSLSEFAKISKGDVLSTKFFIPSSQYIPNTKTAYREISYHEQMLDFKVDEVVRTDQMLYNVSASDIIYIPYDMFVSLMSQFNGYEGQYKPYDSTLKREKFEFNDYVIICDIDKLLDIYSTVIEIDSHYDVFSNRVHFIEQYDMTLDFLQRKISSVVLIGFITLIAFSIVFSLHLFSLKDEIRFLINNGITKNDIKKCFIYEMLIHVFLWIIGCLLLSLLSKHYLLLLIGIAIVLILIIIEYGLICLFMMKIFRGNLQC